MRLIEIPDDGIIRIPIMRGEDTVGERRIDLSYLPTVDAVEVVRCKECKKSMVNPFMTQNPNMVCTRLFTNYVIEPADFCSYGERKDNERKAD